MDTSNRLQLALGELKVPADELTPEEWAAIVEKAANMCEPQLKFFAGFNTAEQWARNEGITIQKGPVVSGNCRKFEWGDSESSYYGGLPFLVVSRTKFETERREERLLLNKAAKFLVWTREYGTHSDHLWTITPLTGPITEDGLLPKYMRQGVGSQVLVHLHVIAADATTKRWSHYDSMRGLRDSLEVMRKRIAS